MLLAFMSSVMLQAIPGVVTQALAAMILGGSVSQGHAAPRLPETVICATTGIRMTILGDADGQQTEQKPAQAECQWCHVGNIVALPAPSNELLLAAAWGKSEALSSVHNLHCPKVQGGLADQIRAPPGA